MNAARRRRFPISPPRLGPAGAGLFLRDFLRRPKEVASIVPSSRFLERRVVKSAGLASARTVVELGPGTGGTTRAVLAALPRDATLLVIEINPNFAAWIRQRVRDPRLRVAVGDAADLDRHLREAGLPAPDVVLSGIPFSTIGRETALAILRAVRGALAPRGRFVAYQVRDRVGVLGRQVFGAPDVELELRNVPPMRVFRWERGADAPSLQR